MSTADDNKAIIGRRFTDFLGCESRTLAIVDDSAAPHHVFCEASRSIRTRFRSTPQA
jgi:hypothetical protein